MRWKSEKGLTLIELLISLGVMGIIATAAVPLLSTTLEIQSQGVARSRLYHEGLMLMEKMTKHTRNTTYLQIPNNHSPTRNMLAVAHLDNEDNDFYFGDPLFPRVDEDYGNCFMWTGYGIQGIDDDGDGEIDDGHFQDDDEDGLSNEEILNGLDDDGDGNIDEDLDIDFTQDGATGIMGIDDDGDLQVDEQSNPNPLGDEDEDGLKGEEYVLFFLYTHDTATNTLREILPSYNNGIWNPVYNKILSTHVSGFTTTYYPPDGTYGPRVLISLTLTGDDGTSVAFNEYVYPRNLTQKTGKKVR